MRANWLGTIFWFMAVSTSTLAFAASNGPICSILRPSYGTPVAVGKPLLVSASIWDRIGGKGRLQWSLRTSSGLVTTTGTFMAVGGGTISASETWTPQADQVGMGSLTLAMSIPRVSSGTGPSSGTSVAVGSCGVVFPIER